MFGGKVTWDDFRHDSAWNSDDTASAQFGWWFQRFLVLLLSALTLRCCGSPCQTVHGGEISNRLASSGVYVCLNMGDPHAPCARVCAPFVIEYTYNIIILSRKMNQVCQMSAQTCTQNMENHGWFDMKQWKGCLEHFEPYLAGVPHFGT